MIETFALAVFEALVAVAHRMSPAVSEAAEQLREAARPPRGVELRADDNALYTGVVIVDRNRPVAMLALRVGERRASAEERPLVTPAADVRSPFLGGQRPAHLDPDHEMWDRPNPYAPRR